MARKRFASLKKLIPAPMFSKEQTALQEMFGGSYPIWGTGNNMPRMDGALISGGGLIKSGDDEEETASIFGLR